MAKVSELDNMRIWNALGKTDPAHTKQFTRAGGFKGTAVKPMWANRQMTEFFGPCGLGWGPDKPEYQIVTTADEILVFCTVGIWYTNGTQRAQVYGVGGDKVTIKGKDGLRNSDEAFKAAYTDALSNAMKFIGVAADVHMGLFDDSKYVQSMREEFKGEQEQAVRDEVERQKQVYAPDPQAAGMTLAQIAAGNPRQFNSDNIPPELDWSYQKTTGVLICRVLSVATRKRKSGGGEYLTVSVNGQVGGKKPDVLTYFHNSHREALKAAVGKVVKLETDVNGDFANIDAVLEIDSQKVQAPEDEGAETKARLLASTLELGEVELNELYARYCHSSWAKTLVELERMKAIQEGLPAGEGDAA